MFSKKILFPMAAIAMASFVACGDDSSSGASDSNVAPASIPTFMDIDKYECSATVNKCAKIYIEDKKDTMQCDGVNAWRSLITGPLAACETAPTADTPADPAAETPADPAAETPADPAAETPAEPAGPAAGGATCYMASDIPGMAECIPVTQEQCATIAGEWVEACPVN